MSLATDSIFIAAIQSNPALVERIGGRLYGTAIPLPDEDADNVPVPYVIVTFDGLNNDADTKDCSYESDYDRVNIGGSQMLYDALKKEGKPVEFLIMKGQGHGYKGIDNQMLYYRTILDFIARN